LDEVERVGPSAEVSLESWSAAVIHKEERDLDSEFMMFKFI